MRIVTFFAAALALSLADASPFVKRVSTTTSATQSTTTTTTKSTTSATTTTTASGSKSSSAQPVSSSSASTPSLLGNPSAKPNPPPQKGLVSTLLGADTVTDRFIALKAVVDQGKADFKYDFNPAASPQMVRGEGGMVTTASRKTYPAVTELGLSGGALFFAPCGLNPPHIHPRASEFVTVATDSKILGGFVLETGEFNNEIIETLTQYQGMVFPQGSIHWQQNMDCKPAVAIAAFSSDDPGASRLAENYISQTGAGLVQASLGFPKQITAENFKEIKAHIPKGFVRGIEECYKRCGLKH